MNSRWTPASPDKLPLQGHGERRAGAVGADQVLRRVTVCAPPSAGSVTHSIWLPQSLKEVRRVRKWIEFVGYLRGVLVQDLLNEFLRHAMRQFRRAPRTR